MRAFGVSYMEGTEGENSFVSVRFGSRFAWGFPMPGKPQAPAAIRKEARSWRRLRSGQHSWHRRCSEGYVLPRRILGIRMEKHAINYKTFRKKEAAT